MSVRKNFNQRGFTLLEALIAIVLLAFAFLSTAGLHLNTLRETTQSAQNTVAAQLADELVSRLRVSSQDQIAAVLEAAGTANASCYTPAGCKRDEMALDEISKWKASVSDRLGGGVNVSGTPVAGGTVCRDTGPGDGSPAGNACTGGASDPIVIKLWWPRRADKYDPLRPTAGYQQYFVPYVPKNF